MAVYTTVQYRTARYGTVQHSAVQCRTHGQRRERGPLPLPDLDSHFLDRPHVRGRAQGGRQGVVELGIGSVRQEVSNGHALRVDAQELQRGEEPQGACGAAPHDGAHAGRDAQRRCDLPKTKCKQYNSRA